MPTPRSDYGPWDVKDVVMVALLALVGVLAVAIAWWGASRTPQFSTQLGWLALATGGVLLVAAGGAVWLLAARRAIGAYGAYLLDDYRGEPPARNESDGMQRLSESDAEEAGAGADNLRQRVASSKMTRYHRSDCILVRGKLVDTMPIESHERAQRKPCGVCRP